MENASMQPQGSVAPSLGSSLRVRIARRIPLILWLLIVALSLGELLMIALTLDRPTPDQWGIRGFEAVLALSFGSVGALIAARRSENRIGWLLLGLGTVTALQGVVDQYPVLAEVASPPLPYADSSRWISAWIWTVPVIGLIAFMPLFFPTGRLLSPRWRWAVLLALVAVGIQVGWIIVAMRPFGPLPPTSNVARYFAQFGPIFAASYLPFMAAAAGAAAALIVRYRRARNEERQQIKWVAFAQLVVAAGAAGGLSSTLPGQVLFIATIVFAALAIAIAVLRYRLYEIDLIINRTLVYGALTAVLAGVYTASITLSQRVFVALTNERSDAAIVITTLIVAATFTPLKTRLQAFVDKRVKPAESASDVQRRGPDAPDWSPEAGQMFDLVARLDALRQTGALTDAEYQFTKAGLLHYTFGPATPGGLPAAGAPAASLQTARKS